MGAWFQSGRIVDLILIAMALELIALHVWRRRTGRGPSIDVLVWNFAAGACLLLALRGALTGSDWWWIGGWLAVSLVVHLVDVRGRSS